MPFGLSALEDPDIPDRQPLATIQSAAKFAVCTMKAATKTVACSACLGKQHDSEVVTSHLLTVNSRWLVQRDARLWVGGIEYKDIANSTGLSNPPANFTNNDEPSNSPSPGSGSGSRNSATASIAFSWMFLVSLQVGVMLYFFM